MVKSAAANTLHYLIRAMILAGFASYIMHLVRSGNLGLYAAKNMMLMIKLASIGLNIAAAQQLYAAIGAWFNRSASFESCDCHHERPVSWMRSLLLYSWFIIPLVLGYALPDDEWPGGSLQHQHGIESTSLDEE